MQIAACKHFAGCIFIGYTLKERREYYIIFKEAAVFLQRFSFFFFYSKSGVVNMRFSVGYQQDQRARWAESILRFREAVAEVYFPWGDLPNGRARTTQLALSSREYKARFREEITAMAHAGIQRNLLLNGMCYGALSLSRELFCAIDRAIDEIGEMAGLHSVTTTSPVIAEYIKEKYPALEVRASVNMDISDIKSMQYLSAHFDSFYIGRSVNRQLDEIARWKEWADANGKKLHILFNSGCLSHCPAHVFHDNLVAHEKEIATQDNAVSYHALCRQRLGRGKEESYLLIGDGSFVRPEDVKIYEPYFSVGKLATRSNPQPSRVLSAYVRGHHYGNLLDLLEPDYAAQFYPLTLDNKAFPEDFGFHVSHCDHQCLQCGYCKNIWNQALKDTGGMIERAYQG